MGLFTRVRFMTPENYGRAALQLPVITTIVTRIMKEALHRVAVREKKHEDEKNRAQNLVLVWIAIPFAFLFSLVVCFVYLQASSDVQSNPWMLWGLNSNYCNISGLGCWLLSSWIELLIEPILIYLESHLKMNISMNIEIISLAVHSFITIALLFSLESG